MKKFGISILIFIFIVSLYLFWNFFPIWMVTGKYINLNFENSMVADVPKFADTLILFPDMTYRSSYYGDGKFNLKHQSNGTKLVWFYKYEFGTAVQEKKISRNWHGKIQISLSSDLNQKYSKID